MLEKAPVEERPLVLVVDDYGPAREFYVSLLEAAGYRVEAATDGYEAVEKALSLQPTLFLMDLFLPGMNGLDVIQRLRADERTRDSPIVVMTGAPWVDQAREAHQAGCDAYLVKPILPDELLRAIRELLNPA